VGCMCVCVYVCVCVCVCVCMCVSVYVCVCVIMTRPSGWRVWQVAYNLDIASSYLTKQVPLYPAPFQIQLHSILSYKHSIQLRYKAGVKSGSELQLASNWSMNCTGGSRSEQYTWLCSLPSVIYISPALAIIPMQMSTILHRRQLILTTHPSFVTKVHRFGYLISVCNWIFTPSFVTKVHRSGL